eukprot:Gb_32691 [translate_table: standard]
MVSRNAEMDMTGAGAPCRMLQFRRCMAHRPCIVHRPCILQTATGKFRGDSCFYKAVNMENTWRIKETDESETTQKARRCSKSRRRQAGYSGRGHNLWRRIQCGKLAGQPVRFDADLTLTDYETVTINAGRHIEYEDIDAVEYSSSIGPCNICRCSDLDFSRYSDTFFEVVFTGGGTQPGTAKPEDGEWHTYAILTCEPARFLQSVELFEENERNKLEIFTALTFSEKLSGLPPKTVFQPLLKDNLVAKGIVLSFIIDFFKEYLVDNSLDNRMEMNQA